MDRILQIVPDMRSGGLETLIMNIYRNVDRSKIQFDFLVHYEKSAFYDKEIGMLGGKIYRLSFREDKNIFKYLRDLKKFFSQHRDYKIVHGHMASLAFIYLYYAKRYGVNTRIIHSHNVDTEKTLKGRIKKELIKFADIFANVRFACSEEAGKFLFKNHRFTVVNNGIMASKFAFDEEKRSAVREKYCAGEKLVVGHVGRFCQQKNHKFLVEVFSCFKEKIPNSQLWLIGDGELKEDVQKYVHGKGLDESVKFLGLHKNVEDFYQGMDIFVLPSLFEGLGIVNIEAQACGLKCILSDRVPESVDITGNVQFISLNQTADEWAEKLRLCFPYIRENCEEKVINAGFDIKMVALGMQKFYLEHM